MGSWETGRSGETGWLGEIWGVQGGQGRETGGSGVCRVAYAIQKS